MLKIERMFKAAVGATYDRRYIARSANKKLEGVDARVYKALVDTSGPHTDSFVQKYKSWKKAYDSNNLKLLRIEVLNAPFKKQSVLSKIFKAIGNFIANNDK